MRLSELGEKVGVKISWVYYFFGGFIGFTCGIVISLIFYMVEKSGQPILSSLPRKYGVFGEYLLELYNALPFFGIVLGLVLVKVMFQKRFENEESDPESR